MAATDFFCWRCGVLNSAGRSECRECGATLCRPEEPPAPPGAPPLHLCPHCGAENTPDATACIACRTRLVAIARTPAGYTTEQVAPSPLPCPVCGATMEAGMAYLNRGGFWRQMLSTPYDWMQLVFRRDEATRDEKVVRPGESVHAQRCPGCNTVLIGPPPPR